MLSFNKINKFFFRFITLQPSLNFIKTTITETPIKMGGRVKLKTNTAKRKKNSSKVKISESTEANKT